MYLKPLSTASVTTTSPSPSCSASRNAPTTFARSRCPRRCPLPGRGASSCRAPPRPRSSTRRRPARASQCGGTMPDQPCIAKEPRLAAGDRRRAGGLEGDDANVGGSPLSASETPIASSRCRRRGRTQSMRPSVCRQISSPSDRACRRRVRIVELIRRVVPRLGGELGGARRHAPDVLGRDVALASTAGMTSTSAPSARMSWIRSSLKQSEITIRAR